MWHEAQVPQILGSLHPRTRAVGPNALQRTRAVTPSTVTETRQPIAGSLSQHAQVQQRAVKGLVIAWNAREVRVRLQDAETRC